MIINCDLFNIESYDLFLLIIQIQLFILQLLLIQFPQREKNILHQTLRACELYTCAGIYMWESLAKEFKM